MNKDLILAGLFGILVLVGVGLFIYTTIHCWSIPLAERTEICVAHL